MSTRRSRLFALLLAAAAFALPGGVSRADVLPPPPDADPFYAVPAKLAGLPNGTVLDSRQIQATVLSIPMPAKAWQVKYKSIDQHGDPSAYVATVLVPWLPWSGGGTRPLLSYQVAEDSVGSKCAPSYALRAGLTAGLTNSNFEPPLIAEALLRGFAVVVPDYQGPHSEFTGLRGYAHGVLDGIRAAKRFAPAGVSPSAPIGLMGYSGGSMATDAAIQTQPKYAPELTLAGAALGGTVADLKATLMTFSGSPTGGALAVGFAGLDRSYPEADVLQYLNEAGKAAVASSQQDCLTDAALKYPFASIEQWEARPGIVDDPGFSKVFDNASPLHYPGTPKTPVLFYHSVIDENAPIAKMRLLAERFCAAGVTVHREESYASNHFPYALVGSVTALNYLADRFARKPAPNDCEKS